MAGALAAWQKGLLKRLRAEWAGFDAVCREELGLDAWTLFKGFEMPKERTAELQGSLSAGTDGDSEGEPDEAAVAAVVASWREAIQAGREEQHAVSAG